MDILIIVAVLLFAYKAQDYAGRWLEPGEVTNLKTEGATIAAVIPLWIVLSLLKASL